MANFDVSLLGAFLLFALLTEGLVENLKWTAEDIRRLVTGSPNPEAESWNGARLMALAVAIALSVIYGIDIFQTFDFTTPVPYVGSVVTGVLFARGSNWVFDFLNAAVQRIKPSASPAG